MPPRRRCAVCGSKQWRKEPSSGLVTCGEGHVLQSYRNETSEVAELGPHTMKKRALKSGRKKREWQSKADPKLYHGERSRYHYYQCLQLLLRRQVAALIGAWALPAQFEAVCRDVWALHLSLLPSPPTAEPYFHATSQYGGRPPEAPGTPQSDGDPAEERGTGAERDVDDAGSSAPSSSDEEDEEDPELEKLLRENSAPPSSSSSEDEEDGVQPRPPLHDKQRNPKTTFRPYDSPAGNIAVLMLACWTLRLPVMYMDFKRVIERHDLPYLDPIRFLPENMTLHLTKQTIKALSPQFPPTALHVHGLTSRLAKLIYRTYGILTPEHNAAPLLWRATRALQGTPTLYVLSKKLGRVLSLTLTLHYSLSPVLKRMKMRDPEHHKYDNAPPEVALIATVLVVLKLVYGLDGERRTPQSAEDPACALPNFTAYLAAVEAAGLGERNIEASLYDTAPEALDSVLELDGAAMDRYIDFCQKALLPPEDRRGKNPVLDEHFPLPSSAPDSDAPLGTRSQQQPMDAVPSETMKATPVREGSSDLRPGQAFRIYNSQDILGGLPTDYEKLVQRAARWAGVEEGYVLGVVERYEHRLVRWWRDERKAKESDD